MAKTRGLMLFVLGATIGSVSTWLYTKEKYEQLVREEIDSVRETFLNRERAEAKADIARNKLDVMTYVKKLETNGYVDYSKKGVKDDIPVVEEDMEVESRLISAEEFDKEDDYEVIELNYYAKDDVLTDERDEVISNVEKIVSAETLSDVERYEESILYICNDRLECIYTILWNNEAYFPEEVEESNSTGNREKKPHQIEE